MNDKWSIRFGAGVSLFFRLFICASLLCSVHAWSWSQEASPNSPPRPYMRIDRSDEGAVTLQIAARKFVNPEKAGASVWLVGASHIGETKYYEALQGILDKQDLVLFEGVGYEAMKREEAKDSGGADEKRRESTSLQATMAESLGLVFQLDAIDYDRANFRNSDVSLEELRRLLTKRRGNWKPGERDETNPEFMALIEAMDGSSWMGKLLQFGFKILGSNPKLQEMSRLMLVEILGQLEGDLSQIQGVPPSLQELLRVLIQSRNRVVLTDLKQALDAKPKPGSIAVFYGAAHMADFETRLRTELGFVYNDEQWFPAVTVDPGKRGLSSVEIAMIRGMVRFQMNMLRQRNPDNEE
ncbi:MAG: hypothetical protein O2960_23095 [Verrucomicrobia bacterium]|nr:hypothetical protein [Verrucomicrobiota bacterium]